MVVTIDNATIGYSRLTFASYVAVLLHHFYEFVLSFSCSLSVYVKCEKFLGAGVLRRKNLKT